MPLNCYSENDKVTFCCHCKLNSVISLSKVYTILAEVRFNRLPWRGRANVSGSCSIPTVGFHLIKLNSRRPGVGFHGFNHENLAGVWKVVFRKLAARLSMYNWELRFSSLEQPVGGGGAQEEVGEQQGEDQVVQGQLDEAGEYVVDPREDQDERREHKHIQAFNKEGVDVTKNEKEEGLSKDRRYKRWLVKLLQLEERWLLKGFCFLPHSYFYRTRVRSLGMLVSD